MNVRGFLMKTIKKDIDGKRVEIKVYKSNRTRTEGDIEMDKRAKSAVKAAVKKAKVCSYPIASYDKSVNKPYIEYPDGRREYGE